MPLSESPLSRTTARSRTVLLSLGLVLALTGILLPKATSSWLDAFRGDVSYLAASLFVIAAGLVSAGMVAHGRLHASGVAEQLAALDEANVAEVSPIIRWKQRLLAMSLRQAFAGWPEVLVCMMLAAFALLTVVRSWAFDYQPTPNQQTQQIFAGLLFLLAFPFLVLERVYANTPSRILPDATQLERLSRVPLATFVGLGVARGLLSAGFDWAWMIERAIGVVIGLVSLELILRGLAMIFVPFAPLNSRRATADSTISGLLRLTVPTFTSVNSAVQRQFGIDLSRSWALAFVRRSALPIGLVMAVFAWCVTAVTALGVDERAVYERLGTPVAIFGPGLHVHLPWPFGVIRHVELGVVHEIPIVLSPAAEDGNRSNATNEIRSDADVEGPAPVTADRLWDETHPSEASYLIASESRDKQSFQVVNVDMRIVWRIGLSDSSAKDAVYSVAEPDALIRALAGRLLVRFFARYTLLDVLGQSRERFAIDFRDELQSKLQDLATGIEVIAVVVEAIHPPAAAASAYHNVQAAEILAQSQIALRRAGAIDSVMSARQTATMIETRATAENVERVSHAQAESVMFDGDEKAFRQDGTSFLFERWLDRLTTSLPKSSFILMDHRLKGAASPTIDLRSFVPADIPDRGQNPEPNQPEDGPEPPAPPSPKNGTHVEPDDR